MVQKVGDNPTGSFIRGTKASHKIIREIAQHLFDDSPAEHKAISVYVPSSKVAVDYMIYVTSMAGMIPIKPLTAKNNLWVAILDQRKTEPDTEEEA